MNDTNFKLRSLFLIVFGLFGYFIVLLQQSLVVSLLIFSIFTFLLILLNNDKTFTQPITLFSLFYYPYSTWFCYYSMLTGQYDDAYMVYSLELSYLGLFVFAFVGVLYSYFKPRHNYSDFIYSENIVYSIQSIRTLILLSSSIILISVIQVLTSGAMNKREVLELSYTFLFFVGYLGYVLTAGILLYALVKTKNNGFGKLFSSFHFTYVVFVLFCGYLFLGERDLVFRFIFCMLMLYFSHKKTANIFILTVIMTSLVLILPVSQAAKGLLLPASSFSMNYELHRIFFGEFMAPSRNLYMLISHGVEHSYSFLVSDFMRAFVPFGSELGFKSTTSWYNGEYRVDNGFSGTSGWGFTLIGQGYLLGRSFGVMVIMSIVSGCLHLLYFRRFNSCYWFVFYLLALSTSIYCIRADMANLFSQIFKIGGLSVALYWILSIVFKRKNFKNHDTSI